MSVLEFVKNKEFTISDFFAISLFCMGLLFLVFVIEALWGLRGFTTFILGILFVLIFKTKWKI
jgi:hypothetical protein